MPGLVHFLDEEKPSRLLQSRLVVNVIKLFVKKSRSPKTLEIEKCLLWCLVDLCKILNNADFMWKYILLNCNFLNGLCILVASV